jgi:SAM-dependent methyltransferase
MSKPDEYVLGTHDDEIARLGLQHRVWRPHMLDAWERAGLTRGSRLIDFGAGPGYATLDAAEIVGPQGEVAAVEQSSQFLDHARREIDGRQLHWARLIACDLASDSPAATDFDIAWCRWVASFVADPARLVRSIAASLRVGGRIIFHEYQHYGTWRVIPGSRTHEEFVAEVMASWRASGGEPDIAPQLLPMLTANGLRLAAARPLVFAVRPSQFMWQWPAAFVAGGAQRLASLGRVSQEWADAVQADFRAMSANPDAIMITPMVLEIIAEKIS